MQWRCWGVEELVPLPASIEPPQTCGPRHAAKQPPTSTATPQAFRHLYVLAAQPRSVDAIDVDTKQVGCWAGWGRARAAPR